MPVKRREGDEVRFSAGLSAIVLAGGAGRRFGGAKLTAPWRGGVLLDGALRAAFAAPAEEVIVVSGADPAVPAAAQAFAETAGEAARLRLVQAADWEEGLAASLRAGITATPLGRAGAFLFLGDMPSIPRELAARLAEHLRGEVLAVVPQIDGGPAHPALIGASLFPAVLALKGDRGARALLEAQGRRLARVAVDDHGVLFDVDTREALVG